MHYSFDYAQQVHIPSNPMQPGPIYFKTPRKCGIFGVASEAVPRQVNFLIDKAVSVGKGANSTISYLHYFLEHHGFGETDRVTLNLAQIVLYELGSVVETSSSIGFNKAQLVGTHDGKVIVPVYDWSAFLGQYFRKLPNITKFHHFRFALDESGIVYYKAFVTSEEQKMNLLKKATFLPPSDLPAKVMPNGLDAERQNYLLKEIRQFCKPRTEDLVAPSPDLNL
ncbi:Hypothetical predicted protein [Paramuricea clavata]|uniref:Uncharacterized protein n=1 Tax=Paramuricea clavata TaxID=317549 RepID=A0A6S7KZB5_PARCT|nr:Hypothetical predicted protein [Paramuricea clavata]